MSSPRPGRRDAIDVARALALLVVVVGHLTLAVVDRSDGSVRGENLLALHPEWAWVAAASPMPIFFAAAGWANARTSLVPAALRLRTLVGMATVVVASWSLAVVVAELATGDPGVVGDGARIATQPVWFLAAYVPFVAAGRTSSDLVTRAPVAVLGGCVGTLAVLDLVRFGLGAPEWIGWIGFFLAWGVPWLAGAWWRAARAEGLEERRTGIALAATASLAAVVLVHGAGYGPALIDAVEGARSNTTPPTLYTAVVGLAQVGLLMACARWLDAVGHRWRGLWDRAGEAAAGIYLWHLSALALCSGVIALGLGVPERLTGAWWLTRPVWWAAVIAVSLGFVAATARVQAMVRRRFAAPAPPGRAAAVAGVILASAGAGLVGLRGPRTVELALACSTLFALAWSALGTGDGRTRPGSPSRGGPRARPAR